MSDTQTAPETPLSDAEIFDQAMAARRAAQEAPPDTEAAHESPETPADDAGVSASGADDAPEFDESTLPEAVRQRLERAAQLEADLQRERSNTLAALNRLQPTQRRLAELERQFAQGAQPPAAAPAPPQESTADSFYDSDEWKAYERDFPQEAAAQRKVYDRQLARIAQAEAKFNEIDQRLNQRLARVDEFVGRQTKNSELEALTQAHPDWQELVQGDAATDFQVWLSSQDEDIQKWIHSDSAAKNIQLLDFYKRDRALADLHTAHADAAAPDTDPNAAAALRAHQRREQTRAQRVAPDLRGASPAVARKDTSQMSDSELFDHLMRERRRQARQT